MMTNNFAPIGAWQFAAEMKGAKKMEKKLTIHKSPKHCSIESFCPQPIKAI